MRWVTPLSAFVAIGTGMFGFPFDFSFITLDNPWLFFPFDHTEVCIDSLFNIKSDISNMQSPIILFRLTALALLIFAVSYSLFPYSCLMTFCYLEIVMLLLLSRI